MDIAAIRRLFDRQMRVDAPPDAGTGSVEAVGPIVRVVSDNGWNGVRYSDLTDTTADAVIAAEAAYFAARGVTCEWKLYSHDQPADLPDRLMRAGFTGGEPEAHLVAELGDTPRHVTAPDGVGLSVVTDEAGVVAAAGVHHRVFGGDLTQITASYLDQFDHPDVNSIIVAEVDGEPVSAARLELTPGTRFAGFWGGATLPQWRRRGIYRALVAYRAKIAHDRGYRYGYVDALPTSEPILRRLGFHRIGTTVPFTLEATR
ncbi:acetyltransferase (GNAT) family protein [Stackebrandtia endophytica]|uniref:Acetyltransferase (GNAT) family protein n=1 Tax=Stackebrandtia endophytica TaxID=1496996 RepID=A0A543APQ4_9ACTN|nr:GNAT family N-acetyltransferase [Stackebrandtia endophytica]TQL74557.1 acetyltransferase (GNAT) family protein [Stackebrandtia endophytica]